MGYSFYRHFLFLVYQANIYLKSNLEIEKEKRVLSPLPPFVYLKEQRLTVIG